MSRHINSLSPLTGQDVRSALHSIRPSSPGMDQIAPIELKMISEWCPSLCDHVASLFNCIEATGTWPSNLPKGAVSFLPKTTDECPSAKDFRP